MADLIRLDIISEIFKKEEAMRVVVTGASGLIGSSLMSQLEDKADVIGLTRNDDTNLLVKTDYSVESLLPLLENADIVVHLAAIRGRGDDYQHFTGNAILTENILKAAVGAGVKRIIYMSSIAVYSDESKTPWTEDQVLQPQTFYGLSKITGEHLCFLYSRKGIEYTILRCGIVLGITNNNRMTDLFIRNAANKLPITVKGKSIARRDFIYLKDVVNALCWSIFEDRQVNQIYNLGSGCSYTNLQIAEETNRAFGNEGNLVYLSEFSEGIKDSRMDSSKLKAAGFNWEYNLRTALNDIREDWRQN